MKEKLKILGTIMIIMSLLIVPSVVCASETLTINAKVRNKKEYYNPGDTVIVDINIVNEDTTYNVGTVAGAMLFDEDKLGITNESTDIIASSIKVGFNELLEEDIKVSANPFSRGTVKDGVSYTNQIQFLLESPSNPIPSGRIGIVMFKVKEGTLGKANFTFKSGVEASSYYKDSGERDNATFYRESENELLIVGDSINIGQFFTVTYDSNGGSEVASEDLESGSTATVPADPSKADSSFGGWYTDPELTTAFNFTTPITANITLYAKWDHVHTLVPTSAVEPTCTEDGNIAYWTCSSCGKLFSDAEGLNEITSTVAPALGHDFGTPVYEWNADNSQVTATRTCSRNVSHVETETVTTTSAVTKNPTTTETGIRTYTASFENTAFAVQTKNEDIPMLIEISEDDITVAPGTYSYNGSAVEPGISIVVDGNTLAEDDYEVSYENNTNAGTGKIIIDGKGAYAGHIEKEFTISPKTVVPTIDDIADVDYNGSAIEPTLVVKDGDNELTTNDYTVVFTNNTNAGSANVAVTLKGNYSGSGEKTFTIRKLSITATASAANKVYDGSTATTVTGVSFEGLVEGDTLTVDEDFEITSANFADATVGSNKNVTIIIALKDSINANNYELSSTTLNAIATISPKEFIDENVTLAYTTTAYTGIELQPGVTVAVDGNTLTRGTDYSVAYSSNTNVGTAGVTVTGIGNYSGEVSKEFTITPKPIAVTVADITDQTYTGATIEPVITVTIQETSTVLTLNTDYTVEYSSNTNVTTSAQVTVKAKDGANYSFADTNKLFNIIPYEIKQDEITLDRSAYSYTGEAVEPIVTITALGKTLTQGTDYDVAYSDNTAVSENAKVIITAKGNYSGEINKLFAIKEKDEQSISFGVTTVEKTYGDAEYTETATLTVGEGAITYSSSNENVATINENTGAVTIVGAGTATITATAAETYEYLESKATYSLTVSKKELAPVVTIEDKDYSGDTTATVASITFEGLLSADTLTKDTDFEIISANFEDASAGNNKNVSVVLALKDTTKANNYTLSTTSLSVKGNILPKSLPASDISLEYTEAEYTGNEVKPVVTVDGLVSGTDYTVTYTNNTNAGTATVAVNGIGNYSGKLTSTFTITPKPITITIDDIEDNAYTGKELKPALTVKNGDATLVPETDYDVAYTNNTVVGTAKANVTLKGNYSGSGEKEFTIIKGTTTITIGNLSQKESNITAVTYTLNPAKTDGTITVEYEVNGKYGTTLPKEVGSYKVRVTLSGDKNLEDKEQVATLTISKRSSTGTIITSEKHKITTKVSEGGRISPQNPSVLTKGNQTFTITPSDGYEIDDVLVDGKSVGKVKSYTLEDVREKHSIEVVFKKVNGLDQNLEYEIIGQDPEKTGRFIDVKSNDWFYNNVYYAVDNGLFKGISETEFAPNMNLTRGMLVTVLYRLAKANETTKATFDDVRTDAYYSEAVAWAAKNGIVNGVGENKFNPEANISRQDLAAMLYRYVKAQGKGFTGNWMFLLDYTDRDQVTDYAYEPICWCTMHKVMNGKGNNQLDPIGLATRAEAAAMMQRLIDALK